METMENIEREFWQNVADLPTTPSKEEPAPAQPAPADSTPVSIVELNISAWDYTEPRSPTLRAAWGPGSSSDEGTKVSPARRWSRACKVK